MESYDIKSVKWLEEKKCQFMIPMYQRGYRWTKEETKKLIEDMLDCDTGNYFIQPIVYHLDRENNEYHLVDGQQRLTTIYLILKVIRKLRKEEKTKEEVLPKYSMKYGAENRSVETTDFLENIDNIDEKSNTETIDVFHMCMVQNAIREYVSAMDINEVKLLENKVLSTQFIFYQIEQNDETNFFERVNSGKIYLTNGELVKALILNRDKEKEEAKKQEQLQWAILWDNMEEQLHNEDFLGMFGEKIDYLPNTKIDFLLEIIARRIIKKDEKIEYNLNNPYWMFGIFEQYNKKRKKNGKDGIIENWKEIRNTFRILKSWYENNEIYHLIGYLFNRKRKGISKGERIEKIEYLINEYEKVKTKKDFIKMLYKEIRQDKIEVDVKKIGYSCNKKLTFNSNTMDNFLEILDYDRASDKAKLYDILLLFNILTFIENNQTKEDENLKIKDFKRFSFGKYKNQKWELEHIHSRASESGRDDINRNKLEKFREFLDKESIELLDRRMQQMEVANKKEEELKEIYTIIFNEIYDYWMKEKDEIDIKYKNSLRNLTLLDKHTNDTYQNDIFLLKRGVIMENDKNGMFIPICTRNVFLKYYSKNPSQFLYWGNSDALDYLEAIKRTFRNSSIWRKLKKKEQIEGKRWKKSVQRNMKIL